MLDLSLEGVTVSSYYYSPEVGFRVNYVGNFNRGTSPKTKWLM